MSAGGGRSPERTEDARPLVAPQDSKDETWDCDITTSSTMFFQMTMSVTLGVFIYEGTAYNLMFLGRVLPAAGKADFIPFFFLLFNSIWGLALGAYIRAYASEAGKVPHTWHEFVREVGPALPVVPSVARWTPGKALDRAKIQDFIYGGPEQSLEERQKCSCTMDARMLLVAFLTFMTYVMYHAQRISFSGVASSMTDEEGFTATKLGTMSTGYMFAYAIGQFVCGRFADNVRPKRALVWGMLGCALLAFVEGVLGSAGCGGEGFCYIIWVLIRITEGLVQATGWTATVAIMGNWFPQEGRGFIMGLWATNANVGDIFGLHVTSALLYTTEWFVILWVLAGFMTVWAVVNMIFLRGAPPPFSLTWQYEEAAAGKAQVATVDEETAGSSASLWKILQVPGLLQYSFSYMFIKLVNYALFLWLPFYLSKGIGVDKSLASLMATRFDMGFIVGAILAGLASDVTTHWAGMPMRSPIVSGFLLFSLIPMTVMRFSADPDVIKWAIFCCGIFQGGPADALTSAVSVDLGKHPSLQGQRAISTVTGIIDGTGAVGAAVGQYMVGMLSDQLGWKSVFLFLLICLAAAFILSLLRLFKELADVRALRKKGLSTTGLVGDIEISSESSDGDR
ncbi:unnamed protein product [Effrenium voratum]|uniref:Major facilitator superfamily (MFS) profile domain-containing protein n=1 Tax=Effrenium voratum TaxID=2562239 RepID=A0AA36J9D3_9DINO|nr:unnamed protein product [Effrenium voratum]